MANREGNIAACPSCGVKLRISGAGRFRCPVCSAVFEISQVASDSVGAEAQGGMCEFHPAKLASYICQGCGALICSECAGDNPDYPACPRCSGEGRRSESIRDWKGYFTDLSSVLFKPQAFFSSILPRGNIGRALLFGIGWAVIGNFIAGLWSLESFKLLFEQFGENLGPEFGAAISSGPLYLIWGFFGSIISVSIMLILATLVIHLCLLIFGGANMGLEATLKGLAYAQAAYIWNVIPLVGSLMGMVWWIVCATVALKNLHRTTTTKALFAILTPAIIAMLLVIVAIVAFFALFAQALGSLFQQAPI